MPAEPPSGLEQLSQVAAFLQKKYDTRPERPTLTLIRGEAPRPSGEEGRRRRPRPRWARAELILSDATTPVDG